MKLPKDIQNHVKKGVWRRLAILLLLESTVITVLLLWGDTLLGDAGVLRTSYQIALILIPFFLSGVPFKMFDRTVYGTVEKVDVKMSTENRVPGGNTRNTYQKQHIYLRIKTREGKTVRKQVYKGASALYFPPEDYRVGEQAFHLYGSEYTILLPQKEDRHVRCAVCGRMNEIKEEYCSDCGHTLIKIMDM